MNSKDTRKSDREIFVAALRWHTARVHRLAIGDVKRRLDKAVKAAHDRNGFHPCDPGYLEACRVRTAAIEAGERLTQARRAELSALRALAKVCEKVRGFQLQVSDANVVDMPVRNLQLCT